MKFEVIAQGGRKKDFWDVHELLEIYTLMSSQVYCVVKVAGIFVPGNAKNIGVALATAIFFATVWGKETKTWYG
jgi:hypothetical protein